MALLTFNLGVEIGQLLTVAAAGLLLLLAQRRLPGLVPARIAALYAIGSLAAYWSIERVASILA